MVSSLLSNSSSLKPLATTSSSIDIMNDGRKAAAYRPLLLDSQGINPVQNDLMFYGF